MGTLDEIADAREAARIGNNRQFVNNSASFYKDNILIRSVGLLIFTSAFQE